MRPVMILQFGLSINVQVLLMNSLIRRPFDILHSHTFLSTSSDWVTFLSFIWVPREKKQQALLLTNMIKRIGTPVYLGESGFGSIRKNRPLLHSNATLRNFLLAPTSISQSECICSNFFDVATNIVIRCDSTIRLFFLKNWHSLVHYVII